MEDDKYDALQGQIEALSLVLTAIITTLPAPSARAAHVHLQSSFDIHCESEKEERRFDLSRTLIREAIVESYLKLLEAASGR
jgi:hypothetical protein